MCFIGVVTISTVLQCSINEISQEIWNKPKHEKEKLKEPKTESLISKNTQISLEIGFVSEQNLT